MATPKNSASKRKYNYGHKVFFWNLNGTTKNKVDFDDNVEDHDGETQH